MTIKEQFSKLKENWLLVLLVIVVLGAVMFGGSGGVSVMDYASDSLMSKSYTGAIESLSAPSAYRGGGSYYSQDFAPEETNRLITKTGNLYSEVEHGDFKAAEEKLKAILKASDAYMLNENVNAQESGWKEYYSGSYNIKVETSKYDAVVLQLKEIGKVNSFTESADDITAQHKNLEQELAADRDQLARYNDLLATADKMEDKITLSDRIYSLEITIKYLEEAIKNVENKVDYSTIYVSLSEKRSGYADIVIVKLSEILGTLVSSFNGLVTLIFALLPYAVAVGLGVFVYRKVKRK